MGKNSKYDKCYDKESVKCHGEPRAGAHNLLEGDNVRLAERSNLS